MSSITRTLHSTTWDYFASRLPYRFGLSPKVVKEAIMTDVNDLVEEFWRTLSYGVVGASFFAMRHLLKILQKCFDFLEVCFDIISASATASVLLIKLNRSWQTQTTNFVTILLIPPSRGTLTMSRES